MRSVSLNFFPTIRIPVPMGPNLGRWSYGVVAMAVLERRMLCILFYFLRLYPHTDVTEVVVDFARTGDGQNHRQGAAFRRL